MVSHRTVPADYIIILKREEQLIAGSNFQALIGKLCKFD